MKRIFKLKPEYTLTQQWLFWLINGILFLFALILIGIIFLKGNYYVDWSPKGFKYFLSEFAFPISILALIIPATALIATMHRSSQLSTQINLLTQQNIFANYYKHYEMFKDYYEVLSSTEDKLEESKRDTIYRRLFPNSKKGDYNVDKLLLQNINKLSKEYLDILHRISENNDVTYLEFVLASSDIVSKLNRTWGAYWLTPLDFGNQFLDSITDVDVDKVEAATYRNVSVKFVKADMEEVIFDKVVKYFGLLARLMEFEISLSDDILSGNLNELINKELKYTSIVEEPRIANRKIILGIGTKSELL
jgi:uncharacterized membrane protein YhaH (DUF805 family)